MPPVHTTGTRSFLPHPPKIPIELVDAFHLEWALRNYLLPIGQTSVPRHELKNWPAAMGITRKRFDNALVVLRDGFRISVEAAGKATFIHLLPRYIPFAQANCAF